MINDYNNWNNGIEELHNDQDEVIGYRYKNSSYAYIDIIDNKIVNAVRTGINNEYNYIPTEKQYNVTEIIDTVRNFNENDFEIFCTMFERELDFNYKPNKYAITTANDLIIDYLNNISKRLLTLDKSSKDFKEIQNKIIRLCSIKAKLAAADLEELLHPDSDYQKDCYGAQELTINNKKVYKLIKTKK
ncbi:MAG: hypothetical protein IJ574_03615 [Bacilli bacterium]|nr:hypothetical protein [Bacilli bacterium]